MTNSSRVGRSNQQSNQPSTLFVLLTPDTAVLQSSLHGAALVHALMGNIEEASASLAQLRAIVEEDWARRRRRRGRLAAVTEGTSHASLIVMETLDAYLAVARVRKKIMHAAVVLLRFLN